jgi:CSLREA domain-containing protein
MNLRTSILAFALVWFERSAKASLALLACNFALAQTFSSTLSGPQIIPDGPGAGPRNYGAALDVPIVVSGVAQGTIDTLSVSFQAGHGFVGDLQVTLISPYGQEHLLFETTGETGPNGGSAANLVITNTYTFSDTSTNNWWTVAGNLDTNIPSGNARTVLSGGPGVVGPAPVTSILSVFQRRPPNGVWKLRFRDGWLGDTGSVASASITLTTTGVTRTVTKTADTDDGTCDAADCSLREAITASSDGAVSVDRIEFARPFFDSPRRIVLESNLVFATNPSPVFAINGPGAPLLNVSGRGLYSVQFGFTGGIRTLAGLRISDVNTQFAVTGNALLHGIEFAHITGRIGFSGASEINDSSVHSSRGGVFDVLNFQSDMTLRRVTISGNVASSTIQANTIFASRTLTLIDCTIVGNDAIGPNATGGVFVNNLIFPARLQNTVIAGNRAFGSTPRGNDIAGSFQSLGHNLIGDVGTVTTINQTSDQTGTPAAPLNPVLSRLGRHGGLIPVHVPLPGSPLWDKGRRVGADVRGVPLVDFADVAPASGGNNGDIGAVEFNPLIVRNLNDSGPDSLRQILADAPAAPAVSDIVLGLSLPPGAKITLTSGELVIDKNVSIHGPGATNLAISGNRQSRVVYVNPNRRVNLSGLTLTDGNGQGINASLSGGLVLSDEGSQVSMVGMVLRNGGTLTGTGGWSIGKNALAEFTASTAQQDTVTNLAIAARQGGAFVLFDRATLSGGMLYNLLTVSAADEFSQASIINSTLKDEIFLSGRTLIRNSLVGGVAVAGTPEIPGLLISGGHNLIGASDSTSFTGPADQVGTLAAPIDLRLSPLAYHGGFVPTLVPVAGSPALDKGLRIGTMDARGQRLFDIGAIAAATSGDNSDIGAVEAQAIFVSNDSDSGAGSLRQAVTDANASTALDDVLFNLTLPSTITLSSRLPNPIAGGALNLLGSQTGADRITISGNSAHQLFSFTAPGHLGLSRLNLVNFRGVDGPALEAFQTEVHLTELEVRGNQASRDGGAMLIGDADAVIENCTFANNSAVGDYGSLAFLGSNTRLQIRGSTFSENGGNGGSAIANVARGAGASVLELDSTTLAGNTGSAALLTRATSTGAATSHAQNTLFSGTTSSINTSGATASFASRGFNLSATVEPLLNQGTDRVNVNPNLGRLLFNGGGTRTHALLIPSAAIDAGIRNIALDQRGSRRAVNLLSVTDAPGSDRSDIGAFELQSAPDNPPGLGSVPFVNSIIQYSAAGTATAIRITTFSGTGSGLGATTTLGACSITGGGSAFPTTTIAQLVFVGAAPEQNLNLPNCVPQTLSTNATLTCPVMRGPNPPTNFTWTLVCPAAAVELIFRNGFE